jgi:hypothetical protein
MLLPDFLNLTERQYHIYDKEDYWQIVLTNPKETLHISKYDVSTREQLKSLLRPLFRSKQTKAGNSNASEHSSTSCG